MAEIKLSPKTFNNKRGQTVIDDNTGTPYRGIRHIIHTLPADNDCPDTIMLAAYRQLGVGWRVLCITLRGDGKTTASFIHEVFISLTDLLSNDVRIAEESGYI